MGLTSPGFYLARARSWYLEKNKKGNFQFVLEVKVNKKAVVPDDSNGQFEDVERPFKRSVFCYLTDKTKERSLAELRSIGYPMDVPLKVAFLENGHEDSVDFSKNDILLECDEDEYPDQKTDRMKKVERWRIARRSAGPLVKEDASQFDSIMESEEADLPQ